MQWLRTGVLLAGIAAGLYVVVQSFAPGIPAPDPTGTGPADVSDATKPSGLVTGLLMIVGAGTVLPFPRAAAVVFVGAAALGLGTGLMGAEPDHIAYGVIAAVLAVFTIVGARRTRPASATRGGPAGA
ncbi:MAG TPA: hypothetical protein VFK61_06045 [Candidatus Limnocylindria bacterium]|jgi:hypothetical protein|nr:hypothetical protein [Candidatus Limnocylindria bacterium]